MTTKKKQPTEEPQQPAPMRVIALQVENIKRVKFARIRPTGTMVEIAGPNGSGKSSVLDAIDWAIRGTGNVPSKPIREGAKSGLIQLQIGGDQVEFQIERTFTKVTDGKTDHLTRLTVLGKNRERFPTPQTLLDGFMAAISFDPLEFTRMDARKQFDTLRKLVKVDITAIDAAKQEAYDARRDAGREVDRLKARLAAFPEPPAGLPGALIDTEALSNKLATAAAHNAEIAKAKARQQSLQDAADGRYNAIAAMEAEIAELNRRIGVAQTEAIRLTEELASVEVGEPIDTAAAAEELQQAIATNEHIRSREGRSSVQRQLDAENERWTELDTTVSAKDAERAAAIAEAKIPIEGLTIGEKEVFFDGLPFDQASSATQIRVSVALAIASNPKLGVMRIKDGALLDKNSRTLIEEMAAAARVQVWIECVEPGDNVAVVMEDGEATGKQTEKNPREEATK